MGETSKLETRTLTITQHEQVWQLLEQAAKRDQQSLNDYPHDPLPDTAAARMDGQSIVL